MRCGEGHEKTRVCLPEPSHLHTNTLQALSQTNTEGTLSEAGNGGQKELCARMPGQIGDIAVCDSWVAQLGQADNPLSV